jgi:hypothetical protein
VFTDDVTDYDYDYEYPRHILGLELRRISFACPEQYDVYEDDRQVGYLRLRHGNFTASYPDYEGSVVYQHCPDGDGIFEDNERLYQLTKAIEAIKNKLDLISQS